MQKLFLLFALLLSFLFVSCDDDDGSMGVPRPRGYFRISMPEKKYQQYDGDCPFSFEIPDYARMYNSAAPKAAPCWRDLHFGKFKATLYISYNEITNDTILAQLINESWALTEAHSQVANGFRDSSIIRPKDKVYGSVQLLSGNAATQVQFYLTDSTDHFIRASLYFYSPPNKDSIAPVLDYIRKDIFHIVETLKWKNTPLPDDKAPKYPAPPASAPDVNPPPRQGEKNSENSEGAD
ncbi:MAG: gliding motility lipoprotein GldD [Bacteroidota bacterium]|nr:gliding motility lipoprotein GldD [Bacteroidota bacterium]